MPQYIESFPKPLLDDLVEGRWIPIVGAGMSRNAVAPAGKRMPLWNDLGKGLAEDIPGYPYSGALDAISAYSHEYSRSKLVERLSDELLVDQASPGDTHRAFCSIPFDIVCTTNLEFLLERQYELGPRYCRPILDEEQLAVSSKNSGVALLKLHGDVHHPRRLVVTEEDYDSFLENYPLTATYLSNLLITRTAVLFGYSLDDPDFRQIWQTVGERLGQSRRLAYAVMVDARPTEVTRFERRGVRVISLPSSGRTYGQTLADAFEELRNYLSENVIPASQATEEDSLRELSLPRESLSRLCFFAIPYPLYPFYREQVFPIAERYGFVPITPEDVVSSGDSVMAKVDALIERAQLVVVDATNQNTLMELRIALSKGKVMRTLVVLEQDALLPFDLQQTLPVHRPPNPFPESSEFLSAIEDWFVDAARTLGPRLTEEPSRLLQLREYRAAVISAITLLEDNLRSRLEEVTDLPSNKRYMGQLFRLALKHEIISPDVASRVNNWVSQRNAVVHSKQEVTRNKAREIVQGVSKILQSLR